MRGHRCEMGEIKPGDDLRAVNGLFLPPPLSPSTSPRLYSGSRRTPCLITTLRDRRGTGWQAGPRPLQAPAVPTAAPPGCVLGGRGVTAHHPNTQPGLQLGVFGLPGAAVPTGAWAGALVGVRWIFPGCQPWFPVSHQLPVLRPPVGTSQTSPQVAAGTS